MYPQVLVILAHGIRKNKLMQTTPVAHVTDGLTNRSSDQMNDHLVYINVLD